MWVVSPWSRGGWVNSQVFDHTSTLLFLEKRFGVVEPQISAYRRAVCGDLTSAFNFRAPNNEPLPTLAGRAATPSSRARRGAATGRRWPTTAVNMTCGSSARTAITAASPATWPGWPARAPHPEIRVGYAGASCDLHLRLRNDGGGTVRFTVQSNKVYGPLSGHGAHDDRDHGNEDGNSQGHRHGNDTGTTWTVTVRAGGQSELHGKLDSTGHGYDFVVTADSDARFSRRVAGRVETGRHSVSDPAVGLADRF